MEETKPDLNDLRIDDSARSRPGSRRGRLALLAALVALVLVASALLWWRAAAAPEVETAVAREVGEESSSTAVLEASGYVTARREATVSSKVTGKVVAVLVEEGMEVAEGQVLARLDDSLVRRQLELAEAQLAAARDNVQELEVQLAEAELTLGRTRNLVAADVAAQAQLDADQARVDTLGARLAAARNQVAVGERTVALRRQELEDLVIRAPFDGVAVSKDAQPGEMISPVTAGGGFTRTGISTIVDMSSLEIEVDVNEAYINRVTDAQRVEAVLDAYPDWRVPAHVITTVPTADRQKATVKVRIAFDELDPRILPDMGVKVSFLEAVREVEGTAPPRLSVPRAAVRRDADGETPVVFVVRGERVERRAVRLGPVEGREQEVLSGLAAGERVVVAGVENLADGQRVRVKQSEGR